MLIGGAVTTIAMHVSKTIIYQKYLGIGVYVFILDYVLKSLTICRKILLFNIDYKLEKL
jgi:hypothetical protein